MKLYSESGGVALDHLQFLLFGGIEDDSLSTVTPSTYLYNHKTKSSQKVGNMLTPRYSFSCKKIGSRVYAIGGASADPDGNLLLLDDCEYLEMDGFKWSSIENLPLVLSSSTALAYKDSLYVFGGFTVGKKRNNLIFKYN